MLFLFLLRLRLLIFFFFFFNDTATTEIYTLSLHDALPILLSNETLEKASKKEGRKNMNRRRVLWLMAFMLGTAARSEEHTSELQSLAYLVCRLLLEKKKMVINETEVQVIREKLAVLIGSSG